MAPIPYPATKVFVQSKHWHLHVSNARSTSRVHAAGLAHTPHEFNETTIGKPHVHIAIKQLSSLGSIQPPAPQIDT
jgi:hypothetical protein